MPLEGFASELGQTKGMKQIFDKHQRYRVELIEENQSLGNNKHAPVITYFVLYFTFQEF